MYKIIPFILLVCISCTKQELRVDSSDIIHPYDNELLNYAQLDAIVSIDTASNIDSDDIFDIELIKEIGKASGQPYETFVKVKQVKIYNNEQIVLLDDKFNQVHIYDMSGTYVTSMANSGIEHSELNDPTFFEIIGDDLIIGDSYFKLEVFDLKSFQHKASIVLGFPPQDICNIGDILYVHGIYREDPSGGEKLIHAYNYKNGELEYLSSFGELYPSNDPWIQKRLSSGSLVCSSINSEIVYLNNRFPLLTKFDLNGNNLWTKKIADLKPTKVIQQWNDDRHGLTFSNNEESDYLVSFKEDSNGDLYIQYLRSPGDDKNVGFERLFNKSRQITVIVHNEGNKTDAFISKPFPLVDIHEDYIVSLRPDFTGMMNKLAIYNR